MTWEKLSSIIKNWTNVWDERPFVQLQASQLVKGSIEGLSFTTPDLETATLALFELKIRSSTRAEAAAEEIETTIQSIGHQLSISKKAVRSVDDMNLLSWRKAPRHY